MNASILFCCWNKEIMVKVDVRGEKNSCVKVKESVFYNKRTSLHIVIFLIIFKIYDL